MHFVLSYYLPLEEGARRNEIVSKIEGYLPADNYVKRLNTFYVVHINSEAEWNVILTNLSNLSKGIPEDLHFIMSPCMTGGRYNGILPKTEWDAINNLSV